jgi:hypothetical protein
MHESYRILPNGTGGRQFATRISLYRAANDARSEDVVPATPPAEVVAGAPPAEPPIAAGQAGGSGAGGGFGAAGGSLEPDPPEEPPDDEPSPEEVPAAELPEEPLLDPLDPEEVSTATGFCAECSVSLSRESSSAASSVARSTISMIRMLDSSADPRVSIPEITGELLAAPAEPLATPAASPLVPPKIGTMTRRTVVRALPAITDRNM